VVPSPQSITAVCRSSTPASLNEALSDTVEPWWAEPRVAALVASEWTTGAAFSITTSPAYSL
jgi:hypothetical protein